MSETRSDGELLRAVAADGDRRAFEELYRRYAPWLSARLRGRCADAGVVDDVVQETFLLTSPGTSVNRAAELLDVSVPKGEDGESWGSDCGTATTG